MTKRRVWDGLSNAERLALEFDWKFWARDDQLPPDGDWSTWVIMAGRGWGKSRTGAETVRHWVDTGTRVISLVGSTIADVRDIMVQGDEESPGLLDVFPPHQRPLYIPARRLVRFHTGAIARTFSADKPRQLRGPQAQKAWLDEFCQWTRMKEAWQNLRFGLRKSKNPQTVVTTTPKPGTLIKQIITRASSLLTGGSTYENKRNLSAKFIREVEEEYGGTSAGKQELEGLLLEEAEGALWTQALIDLNRHHTRDIPVPLDTVYIGVDPSGRGKPDSDECGIVVVGSQGRHKFVVQDGSLRRGPDTWASRAVMLYKYWNAAALVVEDNYGGDMVRSVIAKVDQTVRVETVTCSKSKELRAEPTQVEYAHGYVHHVGHFPVLEAEQTGWVPGTGQRSPNRLDALVFALHRHGGHKGLSIRAL